MKNFLSLMLCIVAFVSSAFAEDYYLAGYYNNWGGPSAAGTVKFNRVGETNTYTLHLDRFNVGNNGFKVIRDSWAAEWGKGIISTDEVVELVKGGGNIHVGANKLNVRLQDVTFTLTVEGDNATLNIQASQSFKVGQVPEVYYSFTGSIDSWSNPNISNYNNRQYAFQYLGEENGEYVFENMEEITSIWGDFLILKNGTWDKAEFQSLDGSGRNMKCGETYTLKCLDKGATGAANCGVQSGLDMRRTLLRMHVSKDLQTAKLYTDGINAYTGSPYQFSGGMNNWAASTGSSYGFKTESDGTYTLDIPRYQKGSKFKILVKDEWWSGVFSPNADTDMAASAHLTVPKQNAKDMIVNYDGHIHIVFKPSADGLSGEVSVYHEGIEVPVNATVGYATMYFNKEVSVPAGTKAYTGTIHDEYLTLKEIEDGIIPARTAVVVDGDGGHFQFSDTKKEAIADNALKGTLATTEVAAGSIMVLGYENATPGFYTFSGTSLGATKAYVEKTAGIKGLLIDFDDETGIQAIDNKKQTLDVYNLQGQRVNANHKGIVVVGGRKFLQK